MNGYDLYYQSMSNRLWDFYKIPLNNADELEVLKHWIDNHTKGEETGGLAVFMLAIAVFTKLCLRELPKPESMYLQHFILMPTTH